MPVLVRGKFHVECFNEDFPGECVEGVMLHETAVSWMRSKLQNSCPARAWQETREEYKTRLQKACREINAEYNVEGLCKELLERLEDLRNRNGDSLKK